MMNSNPAYVWPRILSTAVAKNDAELYAGMSTETRHFGFIFLFCPNHGIMSHRRFMRLHRQLLREFLDLATLFRNDQ